MKITIHNVIIYLIGVSLCCSMPVQTFCFDTDPAPQPRAYANVDYLFWKANEDQLQYAINVPGGLPNGDFLSADQLFIQDQNFKGDSGVRATGGVFFCDDWQLFASWTHFKQNPCVAITNPNNSILTTKIFSLLDLVPLTNTASSAWCFDYDTIDVELSTDWQPVESLTLTPHFGVRGARIHQLQTIVYPEVLEGILKVTINNRNNFSGVGPIMGLQGEYCFWNNVQVWTGVSGALLYGTFHVNSRYEFAAPTEDFFSSPQIINCAGRLRPTVQAFLGLHWEKEICDSGTIFDIGIAYEANYWWNQWMSVPSFIASFVSIIGNGDLSLHGLTLHTGIRF